MMEDEIIEIASRYFDSQKRKGPRQSYLLEKITEKGHTPRVDKHQNIWIERGSGEKTIIISAHIDVDPRVKTAHAKYEKLGKSRILRGVLDNAVGCYINLKLLEYKPKSIKLFQIFTASEEAELRNPLKFAKSAREVVAELKKRKIKPKLSIAIDVTYPRLIYRQEQLKWRSTYEKNFDLEDPIHCYLDGYETTKERKIAQGIVKKIRKKTVAARDFCGYDEAHIYNRLGPSLAFGPVVYGHFDQDDQMMPLEHITTAIDFLKKTLRNLEKE